MHLMENRKIIMRKRLHIKFHQQQKNRLLHEMLLLNMEQVVCKK